MNLKDDKKYRGFDDRLTAQRIEKMMFAKERGFKYWSQLLEKKHKEGMTPRQISIWVTKECEGCTEVDTIKASGNGIYATLNKMGVYTAIKKRGKRGLNRGGIDPETTCTRPGCNNPREYRFLCHSCYTNNSESIGVYGNVQYFG